MGVLRIHDNITLYYLLFEFCLEYAEIGFSFWQWIKNTWGIKTLHSTEREFWDYTVAKKTYKFVKRFIRLFKDLSVCSEIYPFCQEMYPFVQKCIRFSRNYCTYSTYIQICLVWKNIFQNWDTYIWVVNTHTNIQFNSRVVRFVKRFVRFLIIVFSLFKDVLILSLFIR